MQQRNLTGIFNIEAWQSGRMMKGIQEAAEGVLPQADQRTHRFLDSPKYEIFNDQGKYSWERKYPSVWGCFYGGRIDFFRSPKYTEFAKLVIPYTYKYRTDEQPVIAAGWSLFADNDKIWYLPKHDIHLGVYHHGWIDNRQAVSLDPANRTKDDKTYFFHVLDEWKGWTPINQGLLTYEKYMETLKYNPGDDWEQCALLPTLSKGFVTGKGSFSAAKSASTHSLNLKQDSDYKQQKHVSSPPASLQQEETKYYHYEYVEKSRNGAVPCAPVSEKPPHLELLHIPKTGGSSLEAFAATKNVSWGLCHWFVGVDGQKCPQHPQRKSVHPIANGTYRMSNWHIPLQFFHQNQTASYFDPYKGADIFVVIRHPYSKLVSEWNYRGYAVNSTSERMNRELSWGMTRVKSSEPGTAGYFYQDAHFVPQSDYLIRAQGDDNRRVHIIRHERFAEDFLCLMKRYKKDWELPPRSNQAKLGFTLANLTEETKLLAQEVYAKDFEMFGYIP